MHIYIYILTCLSHSWSSTAQRSFAWSTLRSSARRRCVSSCRVMAAASVCHLVLACWTESCSRCTVARTTPSDATVSCFCCTNVWILSAVSRCCSSIQSVSATVSCTWWRKSAALMTGNGVGVTGVVWSVERETAVSDSLGTGSSLSSSSSSLSGGMICVWSVVSRPVRMVAFMVI